MFYWLVVHWRKKDIEIQPEDQTVSMDIHHPYATLSLSNMHTYVLLVGCSLKTLRSNQTVSMDTYHSFTAPMPELQWIIWWLEQKTQVQTLAEPQCRLFSIVLIFSYWSSTCLPTPSQCTNRLH